MDDDDVPETGVLSNSTATTPATAATTAPAGETPPSQPPRPPTAQQKNEQILKEAFPSIDVTVIKAVLAASGGQIDPAFNALLGKGFSTNNDALGPQTNQMTRHE